MKHIYVTAKGSVTFTDDEWERIEQAAQANGMRPDQYLQDEPNHWWQAWADSVSDIEIDAL